MTMSFGERTTLGVYETHAPPRAPYAETNADRYSFVARAALPRSNRGLRSDCAESALEHRMPRSRRIRAPLNLAPAEFPAPPRRASDC